MVKVAPSILSADFCRLAEEIARVEEAGADLIHIDVMDGHFVPNLTVGPPVVEAIRRVTRLPLDSHLMITDPDRYLESFAHAGSDLITVHVEVCHHLQRTIDTIKCLGLKAGVVLNPATPLNGLDHVLDELDMVLLMSVNPGFGGQRFLPAVLPKIGRLKGLIRERRLSVEVEVDGGITLDNARQVEEAGADILVAGTAIFRSSDYRHTITGLRGMGPV